MNAVRPRFLHGPYTPPAVHKGDRTFCLYRDADVVITSWTNARISWPRCRALHQRGGSGLLVSEGLRRAILSESAAALAYWFGVGSAAVWAWRKAFGVSQFGTDGSRQLQRAASQRGAAITRGKPVKRRPTGRPFPAGVRAKRWQGREWTAEQRALLGTMADDELAAKQGRTAGAVQRERARRGIPTFLDRRRRPAH